jgi:hypothetical protein
MSLLKGYIQEVLGEKLYNQLGYQYFRMSHPAFKQSLARLQSMRNRHSGSRCFVIGNGPSLKQTDLAKLRNEYTFGLNRIYLLFPKLGFPTTYHVMVNKLVVTQFGNEVIQQVPGIKFISYDARHWITPDKNIIFLYSRNGPHFYKDISKGIWQGATVTYVAMQIAFHLGFEKVILIGVDHSFSTQGEPHKTILSERNDTDHFDPQYFGKGVRWQLPDLETSEIAYRLANQAFREENRQIVDATIGGKLDIFPKVDYETLF